MIKKITSDDVCVVDKERRIEFLAERINQLIDHINELNSFKKMLIREKQKAEKEFIDRLDKLGKDEALQEELMNAQDIIQERRKGIQDDEEDFQLCQSGSAKAEMPKRKKE